MTKKKNTNVEISVENVMNGEIGIEQIQTLRFEDALELLESVVGAVESGNLPLDQSIGAYEKGTELVGHLRALLSKAEEKLRVLGEDA
jgi:exodeoxyribonuclease VII small subunit